LAFLIGCLFGGAFITTWLVGIRDNIEIALLALAAIALFAYSFGLYRPLAKIQTAYAEMAHSFPIGKRKTYRSHSIRKRQRIIGIHQMSFTEIDHKVRAGARFVVFEFCISPLFVTIDYESDIFFFEPGEDTHRPGLRYILISALFGWFSIFGPISTIHCLISDIGGGKDVTPQVIDMLKYISEQEQLAQIQ